MKKIILLVTSSIFLVATISISAERDCSNPKGFHQKLMCKELMENNSNGEDKQGGGLLKKLNPFKSLNDFNKKTKKTIF